MSDAGRILRPFIPSDDCGSTLAARIKEDAVGPAAAPPTVVLDLAEADNPFVDVSPDGRFLCTASGDSSVRLWSIDYQGTVDALCSRLRRDFTAEERAQFGIPQGATCGALS